MGGGLKGLDQAGFFRFLAPTTAAFRLKPDAAALLKAEM
jgi:hypothetical protein